MKKNYILYFLLILNIYKNLFSLKREDTNFGYVLKNTELYGVDPTNNDYYKIFVDKNIYGFEGSKNENDILPEGYAQIGDIFNIVEYENGNLINYLGDYIKIQHPFYFYEKDGKVINEFYIKKESFIRSEKINKKLKKYIVESYYYDKFIESNLISGTIINPTKIKNKNKDIYLYPGTRLRFTDSTDNYLCGYIIKNKSDFIIFEIKKDDVLLDKDIPKNDEEKRKLFISLLKNWLVISEKNKATIPYFYGGTAINFPLKNLSKIKINEKNFYVWEKNKKNLNMIVGIDCSGLICLAARISGFKFYLRDSFIQNKYLEKVNDINEIKNGDIIWIPGHVMIINKNENTIIESVGYDSKFNGLVENKIYKRFENINNLNDLINLKNEKNPLILISKDGNKKLFDIFEILSLSSS